MYLDGLTVGVGREAMLAEAFRYTGDAEVVALDGGPTPQHATRSVRQLYNSRQHIRAKIGQNKKTHSFSEKNKERNTQGMTASEGPQHIAGDRGPHLVLFGCVMMGARVEELRLQKHLNPPGKTKSTTWAQLSPISETEHAADPHTYPHSLRCPRFSHRSDIHSHILRSVSNDWDTRTYVQALAPVPETLTQFSTPELAHLHLHPTAT
jgi:hypothetical protein